MIEAVKASRSFTMKSVFRAAALAAFATMYSAIPVAAGETGTLECETAVGEPHAIGRITDTNGIVLEDGREIRLSNLLFPTAPMSVDITPGSWPPARESRSALKMLLAQGSAEISNPSAGGRDRYGRPDVQMFIEAGGARVWVQKALVAQGQAIVSSRGGGGPCLAALLIVEAEARTAKRGLWSNPSYRVHHADKPRDLEGLRSNFVLVEGTVKNVTARSGRLYLGFGSDWKSDFTIVVPKTTFKADPDASERLLALSGHNVRIRGWIERRYGPAIEIANLADLEDLTPLPPGTSP